MSDESYTTANIEKDEEGQSLLTERQIREVTSKIFSNNDAVAWVRKQMNIHLSNELDGLLNASKEKGRDGAVELVLSPLQTVDECPFDELKDDVSLLSFGSTKDTTGSPRKREKRRMLSQDFSLQSSPQNDERILELESSNRNLRTQLNSLKRILYAIGTESRAMKERIATFESSRTVAIENKIAIPEPVRQISRSQSAYISFNGIIGDDTIDFELEQDTFLLMITNKPRSVAWALGLSSFSFQIILGSMIITNQFDQGTNSSIFNVPFMVDEVVSVGQYFVIILCLASQSDILASVQAFMILGKNSNWDEVIGEKDDKRNSLWRMRIGVPNMMKLTQGLMVLFMTFVVIVQSQNIIRLITGFSALLVISRTDNLFFVLADYGFLGQKLQMAAIEAKEIKVLDANGDEISESEKKRAYRVRSCVLFSLFCIMIISWVVVMRTQWNGAFFDERYPGCKGNFGLAFEHFGDGECFGGILNTIGCEFEGGDCVNFNLAYPLCKGEELMRVGDGTCNPEFDNKECDYDGGDCICPFLPNDTRFINKKCNGGKANTAICNFDNGECVELNKFYPECDLEGLSAIEGSDRVILGDGICDSFIYMSEECGYEYGDCGELVQNMP